MSKPILRQLCWCVTTLSLSLASACTETMETPATTDNRVGTKAEASETVVDEGAKAGGGTDESAQEAKLTTQTVDGLVRLESKPGAGLGKDKAMKVVGQSEMVEEGDWVEAKGAVLTVEDVTNPEATAPAVIVVEPEASVEVDDGQATVESVAGGTEEVILTVVGDDFELRDTPVTCDEDCVVDLDAIESESGEEVVVVATADEASAVVVPEEAESVDIVLEAAAESYEDQSSLDELKARRKELREEIELLTVDLKTTREGVSQEQKGIQPELAKLRERRKVLMEERKKLSEDLDAGDHAGKKEVKAAKEDLRAKRDAIKTEIDAIQAEIKALQSNVTKLKQEWKRLKPLRAQIAKLRAEMRRLKAEMLKIVGGRDVHCASRDKKYVECGIKGSFGELKALDILEQKSKDECIKDKSYGFKAPKTLWVDHGCRAKFLVRER